MSEFFSFSPFLCAIFCMLCLCMPWSISDHLKVQISKTFIVEQNLAKKIQHKDNSARLLCKCKNVQPMVL